MSFSIKMEVGIEDCLHIEFEYNKSKYAPFSSVNTVMKRNHVPLLMSDSTRYKMVVEYFKLVQKIYYEIQSTLYCV